MISEDLSLLCWGFSRGLSGGRGLRWDLGRFFLAASFFNDLGLFDEGGSRLSVDLACHTLVGRKVYLAVAIGEAAFDVLIAGGAAFDGGLVPGQEFFKTTTLTTDLALLYVVVGGSVGLQTNSNNSLTEKKLLRNTDQVSWPD